LCRHAAITEGLGVSDRMKLVIDEWGCWHPEGSGPSKGYNLFEQQSTMRDAVVAALSLNIFNNHCDKINMANIAQVCNNLHSLFLAQGKKCIVTPTYHVFHMYKEHQGAECLRTLISDNDDTHTKISVSASVKGNTIKLTLANMSCEEDVEVKPNILGLPGQITSVRATLLTADDMRAHNTFESPETVSPVSYVLSDLETTVKLPKGSVLGLDIEWC
ncbi:MAG: alpha-N-arabinofuranosidase, partial [Lachnospiraceae bacterium]|nr:alpha-N-arabinofuranosidase [Lachnospiraceae bacterium]